MLVNEEAAASFRRDGFVVIPDVLTDEQITAGRRLVAGLLAEDPAPDGHAGPYSLWPRLPADGHPLLAYYREVGLAQLAGQLLRSDINVQDPDFAQVATTTPPWPHRPGGPHVDGLTPTEADGRPGTFTMLAGIWLTDHRQKNRGNLWLWPGTHLRFGQYLAERGADALTRLVDTNEGPYPRIELGAPMQAIGTAGSVLFAHYLLAHNSGGHDGAAEDERRETIYYRLLATGHRDRWREAVTNPLVEFRSS